MDYVYKDGLDDCYDACIYDPNKIFSAGVCGCGIPDDYRDTDGDGTPDCIDVCPNDARYQTSAPDSDGDGIPDCYDSCPQDPSITSSTLDSDFDGVLDCNDHCIFDSSKQTDTISNSEGIPDCMYEQPNGSRCVVDAASGLAMRVEGMCSSYVDFGTTGFKEKAMRAMELSSALYSDETWVRKVLNGEGKNSNGNFVKLYNETACSRSNYQDCTEIMTTTPNSANYQHKIMSIRDPGRCYLLFEGTNVGPLGNSPDATSQTTSTDGSADIDLQGCKIREITFPSDIMQTSFQANMIDKCMNTCKTENGGTPCDLVLAGHSRGGAWASTTFAQMKSDGRLSTIMADERTRVNVMTFGMPSPFYETTSSNRNCAALMGDFQKNMFNFVNTEGVTILGTDYLRYDPIVYSKTYANLKENIKTLGNWIIIGDDKYGVKRYTPPPTTSRKNSGDNLPPNPKPFADIITASMVHKSSFYRNHVCKLFATTESCESNGDDFTVINGIPIKANTVNIGTSGFTSGSLCLFDGFQFIEDDPFDDQVCASGKCGDGSITGNSVSAYCYPVGYIN